MDARYARDCRSEYQKVDTPAHFGDVKDGSTVIRDYGHGKLKYVLHRVKHDYPSQIPLLMVAEEVISDRNKARLQKHCQCIFHTEVNTECDAKIINWLHDNQFIEDCMYVKNVTQRAIKMARAAEGEKKKKKKINKD